MEGHSNSIQCLHVFIFLKKKKKITFKHSYPFLTFITWIINELGDGTGH